MRRTTTRARAVAGLTAAAAALVALGTTIAQAAPPTPAAAGTARAAGTTADPAAPAPGAGDLRPALPTAARAARRGKGSTDKTVVAVRFKKGVRAASVASAAPLAVGAKRFSATTRSVAPRTNAATYDVAAADAEGFLASMRARPDVAEASYEVFAHYDATPNDPQYRTASTTDFDQAPYMAAINAPAAWDYGRGSSSVKIAIIDSGVDVGHPDLDGKIVGTRNTFDNSTDVTDTVGHGTFVAGVAAAETNNAVGVAGADWNASILAVKVADDTGGLALTDVAEGIDWAVANGADVINMSLGSTTGSTALATAVANARAANVIVVASAGNSAQEGNPKSYPAAYPGVVSVGATDGKGHRAWFSEHGSWVTMSAPGVDIRSTIPRVNTDFWPNNVGYANGDGTSFSSPLVAGAMALVKGRSPNATDEQVRDAVVKTATGFAGYGLGTGELDMAAAMKAIVPTTTPTVSAPADGATVTGAVNLTADAGMFGSSIGTKIGWFIDGSRIAYSASNAAYAWDPRGYAQGAHTVQARICTTAGVCAATGTSVSVTVDVPAPSITSPADGSTVPGFTNVLVTSPAGGSVAVYDGTTRLGFSQTGTVETNFTGRNGAHALEAVVCNTSGSRCAGTRSATVNVTSAAAALTRGTVTNAAFSPNGDGVKDTAVVQYTITGTQTVRVQVVNAAGTVVRTIAAGTSKPGGTYTTTWNGKNGAATPAVVPAGSYTIRISTRDGSARTALVTAGVRVDTSSPVVGRPAGTATSFYPVVDGFRDTFRPKVTVNETSTVSLVLRNSAGSTVRTLTQTVQAGGSSTLTWNGRNTAGSLVPKGTYTWRVVATDVAGRRTTTTGRSVSVLRTKLTNKSVTLTKNGLGAYAINDGPACAVVTDVGSSYASGLWMKNNCSAVSGDTARAYFHFTAPAAVSYTSFTIRTSGRSHSAPVDVQAALANSQIGGFYDVTWPPVRVATGATTTRTLTLGALSGGKYTTASRVMDLILFVSNDRLGPFTDWDIQTAKVTISYKVLA